jgi:hypothetical protein
MGETAVAVPGAAAAQASNAGRAWEKALDDVRAFLAANPAISMSPTSLSVPRDLREEFYGLIAVTQRALAADVLGEGVIEDISSMARAAGEVRDAIVERSDLNAFHLPQELETLIADPAEALAKPAFGMVLDALQNDWDAEAVVARAVSELPHHASVLRRCAYEAWAYYGVVLALEPVHFKEVFSRNTVDTETVATGEITVGRQITSPERRMPEAVFECADGRVFAMKSEVARELDYYGVKIKRRRDMSLGGNSVDQIAHRVLLLYRVKSLDEAPLVADRDHLKVLASDLMLEALQPEDMGPGLAASMFLERLETMHSKRLVQVLTETDEGGFPDEVMADPRAKLFERTAIGRDANALKTIAGKLSE